MEGRLDDRRRAAVMKSLLALLTIALLGVGVTACGGTGKRTGSASHASANFTTTAGAAATTASGATPTLGSLEGDEDDDDTTAGYTGNSKNDNDADFDNDYKKENKGYSDSDDNSIRTYGRAASAADKRAITALVKRYYAAAAGADGATACQLIYSTLAKAIPEDYGQAPGPAYARGKTCPVVMSKVFKHLPGHPADLAAIEVVGVRVNGNEARALLGSRTMPASFIVVHREGGVWKIDGLLGGPLP